MTGWSDTISLPLVADGAVGRRLEKLRPDEAMPPEALNLSHPDVVRAVHEEFLLAGAKLHRTNSRNANRVVLSASGLEERGEAANNSASAILRDAVGPEALVMGVIGQIPFGSMPGSASNSGSSSGSGSDAVAASPAARESAYAEQIVCLSDTGVTFLALEHFTSLREALLVLRLARSASDAPLLAQLQVDSQGRTADGVKIGEAARQLIDGGAGALGLSCGPTPQALAAFVQELLSHGLPVSVMLGLGSPGLPPPYPDAPMLTPMEFAASLAELARLGVAIVGGCCGASPEHIRALASEVGGAVSGESCC